MKKIQQIGTSFTVAGILAMGGFSSATAQDDNGWFDWGDDEENEYYENGYYDSGYYDDDYYTEDYYDNNYYDDAYDNTSWYNNSEEGWGYGDDEGAYEDDGLLEDEEEGEYWSSEFDPARHYRKDEQQTSRAGQKSDHACTGTIERIGHIVLRRGNEPVAQYTLAQVRTDEGQSIIVNLGNSTRANQMKLQRGDRVKAEGRMSRIDGKRVFSAEKVSKSKKRSAEAQPQSTVIAGTIKQFGKTRVRGAQNEHLLVRLQLDSGKELIVDFGSDPSLRDLELDRNDRIWVRGSRKNVQGKEIVVADKASVEVFDRQEAS